MKKIVINGANGYVASNFINKLLLQDYKVVALARSNAKFSAEERMHAALQDMNDGEDLNFDNLEVHDYSLFEADFSLPDAELKEIFSGDVDYFHFAASLKFDIKSKEEIFGTNLQGVTNSVDTFLKYTTGASRFFFLLAPPIRVEELMAPLKSVFMKMQKLKHFETTMNNQNDMRKM